MLAVTVAVAFGTAGADDYDEDLPSILAIQFTGNATFSADQLLLQTSIEFPSLSHPLRPRPRFRHNTFSKELRRIEEFYRKQGFGGISARLDSTATEQHGKEIRLWVHVREGPQTRIREVRFLPQPVFSLDELRAVVPFTQGSPFPFSAVELGRATRALRLAFLSRGYLAVSVRDSAALSADSTTALLVYHMTPGNQFTVRSVSVTGNVRTRASLIQRELKIHAGQVYAYDRIEQSKQNLYSTGLFRSVTIREDNPDSIARTVDLAVRVSERQNEFVEGSVGFGRRDAFEVKGSLAWVQRNLWGRAHGFEVRTEAAYNLEEGGNAWFTEESVHYNYPHIWDTSVYFAPDIGFIIDQRVPEIHYQEWRINAPFNYQIGRFTNFGFGASAAFTRTNLTEGNIPENKLTTHLLYAALTQNKADDVFNPRRGDVRSLRVERAVDWLNGDNLFSRASGAYTRYVPLGQNVLALNLRGGWVEAYGKSRLVEPGSPTIGIQGVPVEYLFQAGGNSSVRGFPNQSLGTLLVVTQLNTSGSVAEIDTIRVNRGTVLLTGNIELRRPAPYLGRWNVGLALFLDAGNAWEDIQAFLGAHFGPRFDSHYVDLSDLRYGYGFGVRYPTPFGPIRMDLGFPLKRFGKRELHLAVGYPF